MTMRKSAVFLSVIFAAVIIGGATGMVPLTEKLFSLATGGDTFANAFINADANNTAFILDETGYGNNGKTRSKLTSVSTFVANAKTSIEVHLGKNVIKEPAINLNGWFQSSIGRDIVFDADPKNNIVKLTNGYLNGVSFESGDNSEYINDVIELSKYLADKRLPMLYAFLPSKSNGDQDCFPHGLTNYAKSDSERDFEELTKAEVNIFDIRQEMKNSGIDFFSAFYRTDHHWKAETGLWCAGVLAQKFERDYGFVYDKSLLNADNYTFEVLEDYFLGSQGKRVGTLFGGVDDFTVIHPNFETNYETDTLTSNGWEYRTGTLKETAYETKWIEKRDYFELSPYSMYSNGDNAIQIIRNNNAVNDKKILVVRKSFACVVTPFLALSAKESRTIDLRPANRIPNLYDYIDEYNPDLVLFMW
jgi:hypothetical protein